MPHAAGASRGGRPHPHEPHANRTGTVTSGILMGPESGGFPGVRGSDPHKTIGNPILPARRLRSHRAGGYPHKTIENPILLLYGPEASEPARSEEHTSELQSLMRISYAVFFLKNKKNKT